MSDEATPAPAVAERRQHPRRWRRARRALFGLVVLIVLGILGNFAFRRLGGPRIHSVVPERARVGDTVTLEGRGFAPALEDNLVYFGDTIGRVLHAAPDELTVEVPDVEMPPAGELRMGVKVQVGEEESGRVPVTVLSAPEPEPASDGRVDEGPDEGDALPSPVPSPSPPSP